MRNKSSLPKNIINAIRNLPPIPEIKEEGKFWLIDKISKEDLNKWKETIKEWLSSNKKQKIAANKKTKETLEKSQLKQEFLAEIEDEGIFFIANPIPKGIKVGITLPEDYNVEVEKTHFGKKTWKKLMWNNEFEKHENDFNWGEIIPNKIANFHVRWQKESSFRGE